MGKEKTHATGIALGGFGIEVTEFLLELVGGHAVVEIQTRADMAQIMRADLLDAGDGADVALDKRGEPLRRPALPHAIRCVRARFFGRRRTEEQSRVRKPRRADAGSEIGTDGGLRDLREVHKAVFVTFAVLDRDAAGFKVEVGERKGE